jgi:hexokinase
MNVQELINKLKKYPPKLNVGVQFSYPMEEGQIKNTVMGCSRQKN